MRKFEQLKSQFSQYREGFIDDDKAWKAMLVARNDDTHLYNERAAILYADAIMTDYVVLIRKLIDRLTEVIPGEDFESAKLPKDFIEYVQQSGQGYYNAAKSIAVAEGFRSIEDVFVNWERIKSKYLSGN